MRPRNAWAWITAAVLVLSAEGSAVAQSAPARPGTASIPRVEQGSRTTGQGEPSAPTDSKKTLDRQPAGSTGLVLPNAGAPILLNAGDAGRLQRLHGDGNGATSATGHASAVVPRGDVQPSEPSSAPGPRPEDVIRAQINPPARTCFENDPTSRSTQLARLVTVIKVTPAGDVDSVIVANSYGLSPAVVSCILNAARAAKFAPPGSSGAVMRAEFTFPWREDQSRPPPPPAHAKEARAARP